MKNRLSESILTELDRGNIMSDQNVVDICMSFSSRMNLNYKLEGNSAVYEDGTIIKFIVNDDSEIEYYFINNQGDASKSALVSDWSLLDTVTEEPMNESEDLNTDFRGKAQAIAKAITKKVDEDAKKSSGHMFEYYERYIYEIINAMTYGFTDEEALKMVENVYNKYC